MAHPRISIRLRESFRQVAASLASTTRKIFGSASSSRPESVSQALDILRVNWHLGFTAFGSPPVHFQIFYKKFVEKEKWIDEQLYQEIFALSQALPGPASTKMLYCINCIHGGFLAGFCVFLMWCLPGAIGMYGLSLGVAQIGDTLPAPVYALLSGLNSATVGIIALAAVNLAEKAITDKLTRILVFLGGAAGMLYTALWYYPVLMVGAGAVTVIWDSRWLHRLVRPFIRRQRSSEQIEDRTEQPSPQGSTSQTDQFTAVNEQDIERPIQLRRLTTSNTQKLPFSSTQAVQATIPSPPSPEESNRIIPSSIQLTLLTWKAGLILLGLFVATFLLIILLRTLLHSPPLDLSLFANLYLAGTIIFGGGPVVIPLLREYIVAEGWVSPRDFLLGLAIIQSFPGPNFNFAVYLGALATAHSSLPSFAGALLAFIGIFTPGIIIFTGVMGVWSLVRGKRWLVSLLRGVNAGAVGLVFTAVYKLWEIGYVDGKTGKGNPLSGDPWWVAVMAGSFVGGKWFGVSAPLAILGGGVLGLVWYGVTGGSVTN